MSAPAMKWNEVEAESAYATCLPLAYGLAASEVRPFRGDALLAYQNLVAGVTNVMQHAEEVKRVPDVSTEVIESLPNHALALRVACKAVNRQPESTEVASVLPRASQLRRHMLCAAEVLVTAGVFPKREVEAIRRGSGKIDTADDLVQLAKLFRKYASEAQNKHPIGTQEIAEASELGTRMMRILKPAGSIKNQAIAPDLARAVDIRDRIFTLIVKGYEDHLWRAGAWLFRTDVDTYVPPLMSRRVTRRKGQETTKPSAKTTDPVSASTALLT